jgi:hypothetical protein
MLEAPHLEATMMKPSELDTIDKLAGRAFEALHDCARNRRGHLRMSIPAREDDDDILLDRILLQVPRLVAEIRRLQARAELCVPTDVQHTLIDSGVLDVDPKVIEEEKRRLMSDMEGKR